MQSQQVLERFLATHPAAKKIAADIEQEKETQRIAIRERMAKLRRERDKAVSAAEPVFIEAKQRHQDALNAVKPALRAIFKADSALKNARGLYVAELARLEKELGAIK